MNTWDRKRDIRGIADTVFAREKVSRKFIPLNRSAREEIYRRLKSESSSNVQPTYYMFGIKCFMRENVKIRLGGEC